MKNQRTIFITILVVLVLVVVGVLIFNNREEETSQTPEVLNENGIEEITATVPPEIIDQENGIEEVITTVPSEIIDQETGEVDQEAFEEMQKLSDDTSLETIEAELNNTIILEEDFSDL